MKKVDSIMYDDNKMMDQPFLIFMHATVVRDWSSMHTIFSRLVHAHVLILLLVLVIIILSY